MRHLRSVLEKGKVFSRKEAEEHGVIITDAAYREVLDRTEEGVKAFVRMYYFPNSPTIYDMQGVHSKVKEDPHHMPIPVLLLFDPKTMSHENVWFLDGNAASRSRRTGDIYTALHGFDWGSISERGPYNSKEQPEKTRKRNAEFHYPNEISKEYISSIVFRSEAEYNNAVFMFGKNPLFTWDPDMFPQCDSYDGKNRYYRNYLVRYSLELNKISHNKYNLHLETVFKNPNTEAYDKKIKFTFETSPGFEKIEKKKNRMSNSDGTQKLIYDIPLNSNQIHFTLEYDLDDTCVLYYKR